MKIVVVANEYPSVSQTFVEDHISALVDDGHEVIVLVADAWSWRHSAKRSYTHEAIYAFRPSTLLRLPHSLVSGALSRRWLMATFVNLVKRGKRHLPQFFLDVALSDFKVRQARLMHAHFGTTGRRVAEAKLAKIIDVPLVVTFHGYDATRVVRTSPPHYYDNLFKQSSLIFAVSDRIKRILTDELGVPPLKCKVSRVGLPRELMNVAPKREPHSNELSLLTVGRLVPKKGQIYAISAAHLLATIRPDIKFRLDIVGDGPELETLEQQSRAGPAYGNIRFHGALARNRVLELIREATLLVHPSITASDFDEEGIPVVIMESMALSTPVLSTEHAGIPELVIHDDSGFLVPERDAGALCSAIELLYDEPQRMSRYASAALIRVRALHDGSIIYKEMLRDYETIQN